MVHDNKTHPLKGMKASKLPKLDREKEEYSLDQMERARALVLEQLKEDLGEDYDSIIENKDAWQDEPAMYFRGSKEYELIKNKKSTAVIETTAQEFKLQKKFLQKNEKRCDKIESALDVMFKKYKERNEESSGHLAEMNEKLSNLEIEKSVFETLQMQES